MVSSLNPTGCGFLEQQFSLDESLDYVGGFYQLVLIVIEQFEIFLLCGTVEIPLSDVLITCVYIEIKPRLLNSMDVAVVDEVRSPPVLKLKKIFPKNFVSCWLDQHTLVSVCTRGVKSMFTMPRNVRHISDNWADLVGHILGGVALPSPVAPVPKVDSSLAVLVYNPATIRGELHQTFIIAQLVVIRKFVSLWHGAPDASPFLILKLVGIFVVYGLRAQVEMPFRTTPPSKLAET